MAGKKGGDKKGKKAHKNKPTRKKHKLYKIVDGKISKANHCPRCEHGIFLSAGQNRKDWGKCLYIEFKSKESFLILNNHFKI